MSITPVGTEQFWLDIRDGYLAKERELSEASSAEIDSLEALRNSSTCLSDNVEHLEDLVYADLVKFVRASSFLSEEFSYDDFGGNSADLIFIVDRAAVLADSILLCSAALSLPDVEMFEVIAYRVMAYLERKPSKHQMEQFGLHGINWEGEVRGH